MGYLTQAKLDEICTRTANGGAEITKLVGTSAWYAPGRGGGRDGRGHPQGQEADPAVLGVPRRASTASSDQFLGVPVKLGKGGAEKIIEIS